MPKLKKREAPAVQDIANINLPNPEIVTLDNGLRMFVTNMGSQPILRVEVVFMAGRLFETKQAVSRATNRLLREGTQHRTAAEVAELVDFYGGTLQTPVNLDTSNFVLFSLNKYAHELLPLLTEILFEPAFDARELSTYIENNQQRLQIDLSQGEVVAYRQITEAIFGEEHAYGYNSSHATYTALTRDDLIAFHQTYFTPANATLFVSGMITDEILKLLNDTLGKVTAGQKSDIPPQKPLPALPRKIFTLMPDSMQTAIRIGRRLFARTHPDYAGMYVVNTILGGYFGSRLMSNIREDKGFTYNISSGLDPMLLDGYFSIATEVGNQHAANTLREIYTEMAKLRTELVGDEELSMVRNYLLGTLLAMLDGAFSVSEVARTFLMDGAELEAFQHLIHTVKTIDAEQIRHLAQTYLKEEDLCEVIVGPNQPKKIRKR